MRGLRERGKENFGPTAKKKKKKFKHNRMHRGADVRERKGATLNSKQTISVVVVWLYMKQDPPGWQTAMPECKSSNLTVSNVSAAFMR